jgi:response regulator RpfG family c-di-GMP phosphodiesterase
MAHEHPEPEDAAPSCPHDDLEPYYAGSPVAGVFAPGLEESDLIAPQLADETPWRGRQGHAPDLSKRERARRDIEAASPEALAAAQARHLVTSEAQQIAALAQPPARPSPAAPEPATATAVLTGSLRVLVVHPSPATRTQVANALGSHGFEVSACGDMDTALRAIVHERPDAVIAEIQAGDIDALALCRTIQDRGAGTPVLLVAPGDDEGHYSLAMEAGAAEYLRRPITPELMVDRLRQAVTRTRSARAVRGEPELPVPTAEMARQMDRQVRRQELKIQSLFELSRNVVGCLELDELYHGFLLTAMGQLGLGAGILYHLDGSGGGRLLEVVSRGIPPAEARRLLDFRAGLGAYLLRTPHPVLLEPDCCPPEMRREVERLQQAGLAVACPMASKGSPVGVALFGSRVTGEGFTADDLLLLSAVCNFAGPALDSARLYTELHLTYLSTVRAFVSSLEAKDTYTRGHSERVADYARVLAQACGHKRHDLDMVMFGAMLHDIGKIGVAEGILNKPGPLTPDEWRVVRAHPEMGARIVSHIDYLSPAVGLILHHHERIDGRGYPHGLNGDEIELGARIVTVVDSFDAMTTHRPYRRAMDIGQAVKLLKTHAGRQFDAQIVDTFLGLLESGTVRIKS